MSYFKQVLTVLIIGMLSTVIAVKCISANGVPNISAGQSNMPRIDFVDVSSWNGQLSVNDFNKMKAYGVKGVIVKLTEGQYYLNPNARTQINAARQAGLKVAVYHYSKFNSRLAANKEADYFLNQIKHLGLSTDTVLVDDLEDTVTQNGRVTENAIAFRDYLSAAGYHQQMLYTSPNFIAVTKLNVQAFGNRNIWMASYPYQPTSYNLWHTQYGAWQWNSKTTFPGVTGLFDVSVDYGSAFLQQPQSVEIQSANIHGLQNNKLLTGYYHDGTGWYWFENGQRYTGFRYYMGTYYWFTDGVRQNDQWQTAWGYRYYVDNNGRAVQKIKRIGEHLYYFGDNGTYFLRTNQFITVDQQTYYANEQGILSPWRGYINVGAGWRWYEKGQLYTGFRYHMGAFYWFDQGVRQENQWRSAWGHQYYVGHDGRAVQGYQKIGRRYYYFGNNGTYYLR